MAIVSARSVLAVATVVPFLLSLAFDGAVRAIWFPKFGLSEMPPMHGRVALVTGPTIGGIGFHTALELARAGATVVIAGRNAAKGEEALAAITGEVPGAAVEFLPLDLSSLAAVRDAATAFQRRHSALHILVLNAGIMATPFGLSADGYELQFASNHLGHFLLTYLLADLLAASSPARVVVVSSAAHYIPQMLGASALNFSSVADVDSTSKAVYSPWAAYGRSKLCNVLFATELAARFGNESGVYVNSLHPGGIRSGLQQHMWRDLKDSWGAAAEAFMRVTLEPLFMSPRQGCVTQLFLAASPAVEAEAITGAYYHPQARRMPPSSLVTEENRVGLWALSMELTHAYRGWFAPSSI